MGNLSIKREYFTILNFLLIFGAAYYGVDTFYSYLKSGTVPYVTPVNLTEQKKAVKNVKQVNRTLDYYNQISKRNLFKIKDISKKKKPGINLESLKLTDLKLKLLGTIVAKQSDNSRAIIGELHSRESSNDIYKIGDRVKTARLKMILREKVILTVNGKDEILEMERQSTGTSIYTRSTRLSSTQKRLSRPSDLSRGITLKRADVDNAVKDANKLMSQIRIKPYSGKGKDGFQLSRIASGSLFSKMGFKTGDIITGVNGNKLNSMDDVLGLYKELKKADSLSIQRLNQYGKETSVNYNIK
jgi:general secretion pathway protein C